MLRGLFLFIGVLFRREEMRAEHSASETFGSRSMPITIPKILMGVGFVLGLLGLVLFNGSILLAAATMFGLGFVALLVEGLFEAFK